MDDLDDSGRVSGHGKKKWRSLAWRDHTSGCSAVSQSPWLSSQETALAQGGLFPHDPRRLAWPSVDVLPDWPRSAIRYRHFCTSPFPLIFLRLPGARICGPLHCNHPRVLTLIFFTASSALPSTRPYHRARRVLIRLSLSLGIRLQLPIRLARHVHHD